MAFIPQPLNVTPTPKQYKFQTRDEQAPYIGSKSMLGTYVISNLEFPGGTYKDLNDNEISFPAIRFDTVLMGVTQERIIVKTKVAGANGTVKQYISEGDFDITATGRINSITVDDGEGNLTVTDPGNVIPEEEIRRIFNTFMVPESIKVVSDFLELFNVSTVVVDKYDIQEIEGSVNEFSFTIKMSSDTPIELL